MKKKPLCFLSNPSYQSQAENDCFTCSFQSKCLKKLIEEMRLQSDIEIILDTFNHRLNSEYSKAYLDIRREVARELLTKIGGPYETKKEK